MERQIIKLFLYFPQTRDQSLEYHLTSSTAVSSVGLFKGVTRNQDKPKKCILQPHSNYHPPFFFSSFFFSDIRECGIYILIRFLFTCTWENNQSFSCLPFIQKVPPREYRVIPYRPVKTCPGEWPFLPRSKGTATFPMNPPPRQTMEKQRKPLPKYDVEIAGWPGEYRRSGLGWRW